MQGKNNKHVDSNRLHPEQTEQRDALNTHSQKANVSAHDEAEKDMEKDPELTTGSPNDDLDEGESARLGEDTSGLV
jgi:hypothetical protein